MNLNTLLKHKHQGSTWRTKQKEGMKSEFDQFNLNTKVGWIAPNGINNGEDRKIVLGCQISHLRSLKLELITQPKRVLNKEVLWQAMLAGAVSLWQWVVGVNLPPATQQWSPPQRRAELWGFVLQRTLPRNYVHGNTSSHGAGTLCFLNTGWLTNTTKSKCQTSKHNSTLCFHLARQAHRG